MAGCRVLGRKRFRPGLEDEREILLCLNARHSLGWIRIRLGFGAHKDIQQIPANPEALVQRRLQEAGGTH